MADVTLTDRLTLKRNTMLQKRLQVLLQIMGEEYRTTRKDLEQYTRDLADFLVYVRHTVPGVGAYGQPDTRAMKRKTLAMRPGYQLDKTTDIHRVLLGKKSHKEIAREKHEGETRKDERGGSSCDEIKGNEDLKYHTHYSDSTSKIHCFRNHDNRWHMHGPVNRDSGSAKDLTNNEARQSRRGSRYRNEPLAELEDARRSLHHGAQSAKYGRSACTPENEIFKNRIFKRFDVIFYDRPHDKMSGKALISSSDKMCDASKLEAAMSSSRQQSARPPPGPTMTTRLTWSAPHRCTRPVTSLNVPIQQRHASGCLPTYCPSHPIELPIQQRHASGCLPTSCPSHPIELPIQQRHASGCLPTYCPSHPIELPTAQQRPGLAVNYDYADSVSDGEQFKGAARRPKTARPNYELKQKSVPAPRQQVMGFQAEAQSRRADTQAILTRSKQLQLMVKMMAPQAAPTNGQDDGPTSSSN